MCLDVLLMPMHIPDAARQKLDKKAEKLRFIGYSKVSKGYRLINEKTKKVVIRHDVIFNETDFGLGISKPSTGTKELLQIDTEESPSVTSAENGSESEPRHSVRIHRPLIRYGIDEYCDTATVNDEVSHCTLLVMPVRWKNQQT